MHPNPTALCQTRGTPTQIFSDVKEEKQEAIEFRSTTGIATQPTYIKVSLDTTLSVSVTRITASIKQLTI